MSQGALRRKHFLRPTSIKANAASIYSAHNTPGIPICILGDVVLRHNNLTGRSRDKRLQVPEYFSLAVAVVHGKRLPPQSPGPAAGRGFGAARRDSRSPQAESTRRGSSTVSGFCGGDPTFQQPVVGLCKPISERAPYPAFQASFLTLGLDPLRPREWTLFRQNPTCRKLASRGERVVFSLIV